MATIANRTEARAWPLSPPERALAYVLADFFRRQRSQGRSEASSFDLIARLWPAATPPIIDAALFLVAVRADGWS
jgi:hypothetical protein